MKTVSTRAEWLAILNQIPDFAAEVGIEGVREWLLERHPGFDARFPLDWRGGEDPFRILEQFYQEFGYSADRQGLIGAAIYRLLEESAFGERKDALLLEDLLILCAQVTIPPTRSWFEKLRDMEAAEPGAVERALGSRQLASFAKWAWEGQLAGLDRGLGKSASLVTEVDATALGSLFMLNWRAKRRAKAAQAKATVTLRKHSDRKATESEASAVSEERLLYERES
ncbi:MAG: hypothetical protein SF028_15075 [Candidatus Sumerlaeia bacterium]|nr:hypothetical protein [Candidatus Sumerlaeia bacterium]